MPRPLHAPGQAIRCATAVQDEVDLAGDDIAGASMRIAADIAALARPGEILVSRTVRDLVTGSGTGLTPRGQHKVGGGEWALFAVTG